MDWYLQTMKLPLGEWMPQDPTDDKSTFADSGNGLPSGILTESWWNKNQITSIFEMKFYLHMPFEMKARFV